MSPAAGSTHSFTLSDGTTTYGFMVPSKNGRHPYSIQASPVVPPRFMTESELTRAQFPPEVALLWYQGNWAGGIGGINHRTHPLRLADATMINASGNEELIRLARRVRQTDIVAGQTVPAQLVPCGFVTSGSQAWAFLGRRPYQWDFTNTGWLARNIPFDSDSHIRNGVVYAGNIYAARWADDVGSGGSYTADDEPSIYIYKAPGDAQWTASTLGQNATVTDAFKFFAVADGRLWGGNSMTITDSGLVTDQIPKVDAVSSASTGGAGSSLTISHTIGTNTVNRILIVGVSWRHDTVTVSSVTWGGTALTRLGGVRTSGVGDTPAADIWYLTNAATGTANVVITLSASAASLAAGVMSVQNVNQTAPLGSIATATGGSGSPSVSVGGAADDLIVDACCTSNTNSPTVGAGQTSRWNLDTNQRAFGSTEIATGASTLMDWTGAAAFWAQAAVAIKSATTTSTQTAIFTTGTPSSQFAVGDVMRIENEYILVTVVTDSPARLNVVRAYRGTVGAAHANALKVYKIARNVNGIRVTTDGTNTGTWGGLTTIGDTSSPITALVGANLDLLICKTDGLYRYEPESTIAQAATELFPDLRNQVHPDNYKGSIPWNNKAICPKGGGGLLEVDLKNWTLRDISPRLYMPERTEFNGQVVALAGEPSKLYALVYESANTRYHLLMAEWLNIDGVTEYRWHHLGQLSYTTGTDINHAALYIGSMRSGTTDHARVWAGIESTGATVTTSTSAMPYFMPLGSVDAQDEITNNTTDPEAVTVVFDANLPNVIKRFQNIRFTTRNLGAGATDNRVQVQYRVDGGAWTYVTGSAGTSTLTTSPQVITFQANVTGRTLELRFLPIRQSAATATGPEILDFTLTCQLRADTVPVIMCETVICDGQLMLNGAQERNVQTKLSQLVTWRDRAAELTLVVADNPFGTTSYTAVFLPQSWQFTVINNQRGMRPEYHARWLMASVA